MPEKKTPADFITDMTSLDVVTLTGNLTLNVNDIAEEADGDGDKPLRFSKIMRQLQGKVLKRGSQIEALAATHVSIDKDTVTFVKENLSPQEQVYLQFHNETVKAAGVARAAMADGIAKLLLRRKD